jgi:multidrug transporter EmrE-like cation transporter
MDRTANVGIATHSFSNKANGHIFLAACLFFGTCAQLLLKFSMIQVQTQPAAWLSYFWIICGLGVYTVGTAFWLLCLNYLDLSYAYPFTGLTYVLILGACWLLFGDKMSWQRIIGVLLICSGIVLIPEGSRRNS